MQALHRDGLLHFTFEAIDGEDTSDRAGRKTNQPAVGRWHREWSYDISAIKTYFGFKQGISSLVPGSASGTGADENRVLSATGAGGAAGEMVTTNAPSMLLFLQRHVAQLSPLSRLVLKNASCIGLEFSLHLLCQLMNDQELHYSTTDIRAALQQPTDEELIAFVTPPTEVTANATGTNSHAAAQEVAGRTDRPSQVGFTSASISMHSDRSDSRGAPLGSSRTGRATTGRREDATAPPVPEHDHVSSDNEDDEEDDIFTEPRGSNPAVPAGGRSDSRTMRFGSGGDASGGAGGDRGADLAGSPGHGAVGGGQHHERPHRGAHVTGTLASVGDRDPQQSDHAGDSENYQFLHDKIHESIYIAITPDERAEIHLRIAQIMLRQHADAFEQARQTTLLLLTQKQSSLRQVSIVPLPRAPVISQAAVDAAIKAQKLADAAAKTAAATAAASSTTGAPSAAASASHLRSHWNCGCREVMTSHMIGLSYSRLGVALALFSPI